MNEYQHQPPRVREYVTLEALCGTRVLDARGEWVQVKTPDDYYDGENAFCMVLRLDGVLYRFTEDPGDGYRSGLAGVIVLHPNDLPGGSLSVFPPMVVTVGLTTRMVAHDEGYFHRVDEVLYVLNEATGLVVCEVGTTNTDDYYPSFVHRWDPLGHEAKYLAGKEEA